jgi:hypothetical protein
MRLLCGREFSMKIGLEEITSEGVTRFISFRSVQKQAVMKLFRPKKPES